MAGLLALARRLLGGGEEADDAGTGVPAMDGVFRPDNRLEQAERVLDVPDIDNLIATPRGLFCSSHRELFAISIAPDAAAHRIASFDGKITFAASGPNGRIALGVERIGIVTGDADGAWTTIPVPAPSAHCMTAGTFLPDGRLAICIGSDRHQAGAWKRDLMELGRSGSLIVLDLQTGSVRDIVRGLAFPHGVATLAGGRLAVSESWRHRLVEIDPATRGAVRVLAADLPAYPARLSPAGDGGFWLALFAPRRQLFEMVLREDGYRREMIETIDPADWIGPELSTSGGPDMPLQRGSVRQMGVLKPWAPSRSYGLVARCDANGSPMESWHSRADGSMHGITAVCDVNGEVFAASRGSGTLLKLAGLAGEARLD